MKRNMFGYSKKHLIETIATCNNRSIFIDNINTVEELNYVINWLKENYVIFKISDDKHKTIDFTNLTDKDISNEEYLVDTRMWIYKHDNGFLNLELEFCREHEWDFSTISFSFKTIFEKDMIFEKFNNNRKPLTQYLIDNLYGRDIDIKINSKEECEDFIDYCLNNFVIFDIMLIEKNARRLDNTKFIKKDFMFYCEYRKYEIAVNLDGGDDVYLWIMVEDSNHPFTSETKLINWFDLRKEVNR